MIDSPHIASDKPQTLIRKKRKIWLSGGGTSGHIYPALALAQELKRQDPDVELCFIGTRTGLESRLIPEAGYPYKSISAGPFPYRPSPQIFTALRLFFEGRREAFNLLQTEKPNLVVGTGGYVCGPLLAAARKCSIPVLIHEQNAYAGRSNRLNGRKGSSVCLGSEAARKFFPYADSVQVTGNPIRSEFFSWSGSEGTQRARAALHIPKGRLEILLSGGSLGARQLNRVAVECALRLQQKNLQSEIHILLAAGTRLEKETQEFWLQKGAPELLEIQPYLSNMVVYMAAADLIIGRAGASTCAEIAALQKPSVFIPYPYAAADHQMHNAQTFVQAGAGLCFAEKEWTAEKMEEQILSLLENPELWQERGKRAAVLSHPRASEELAACCFEKIIQE